MSTRLEIDGGGELFGREAALFRVAWENLNSKGRKLERVFTVGFSQGITVGNICVDNSRGVLILGTIDRVDERMVTLKSADLKVNLWKFNFNTGRVEECTLSKKTQSMLDGEEKMTLDIDPPVIDGGFLGRGSQGFWYRVK